MDWERFEQLIEAELDGEMAATERAELDAVCAAEPELAEIRRADNHTARLLRRVGPSLAPEGMAAAVMERLDAERAFERDAYEAAHAGETPSRGGDSNAWPIYEAPAPERRSIWLAIFGSQALRASFALAVMIIIVYQASVILRKPIDRGLGAIIGTSTPEPPPASRQIAGAAKRERFQEPAGPALDESAYFVGDPPTIELAAAVGAAPTPAGEEAAFEGDVDVADAAPLPAAEGENSDGTIAGTPDVANVAAERAAAARAEAMAVAAVAPGQPGSSQTVAIASAAPAAEPPAAAPPAAVSATDSNATPIGNVMERIRQDMKKLPEVEIASATAAPPAASLDAPPPPAQPGMAPVSKTKVIPPVAPSAAAAAPVGVELGSLGGAAVASPPSAKDGEAARRAEQLSARSKSPRVMIQLAQAAPATGLPSEAQAAESLAPTARSFAPTRGISAPAKVGRRHVETSLARARIDFLRTVDASDGKTARYRCRASKAQLDAFFRDLERQGIGGKRAAQAGEPNAQSSFYSYSGGPAQQLPAGAPQEVEIIVLGGAE